MKILISMLLALVMVLTLAACGGNGYMQGIDKAAAELGIHNEIVLDYIYANSFSGDADITAEPSVGYTVNTYANIK